MAKKTKKTKDSIAFILEGKVFIQSSIKGKVTRAEIDGELVLRVLEKVLKEQLDREIEIDKLAKEVEKTAKDVFDKYQEKKSKKR